MPKLVLAMQQRILLIPMKENIEKATQFSVTTVQDLELISGLCVENSIDVALIEVKLTPPWNLGACVSAAESIREYSPKSKIVFLCDSKNGDLGKRVMEKKREGAIDAFVFSNTSYDFLIATLESLIEIE